MNPQVFFDWAIGKYLDWDGSYGAQCVDVIQFYAQFLGLHTFWGNAIDIINQADASYQWVSDPIMGDIVVIIASPANGWAGHVAAIYAGAGMTFGQNYPDGSPCHYQRVNDPVAGYLRPVTVNSGGSNVDQTQQIQQLQAQLAVYEEFFHDILVRLIDGQFQMTSAERQSGNFPDAGQTFNNIAVNPQADANLRAQIDEVFLSNIGRPARKDEQDVWVQRILFPSDPWHTPRGLNRSLLFNNADREAFVHGLGNAAELQKKIDNAKAALQ